MAIPTITVKVPHSQYDGSVIEPDSFAYDITAKKWKHKLTIAREVIESYTKSVITQDNLVSLGVPLLQEKNFVTHDVERANLLRASEIAPEQLVDGSISGIRTVCSNELTKLPETSSDTDSESSEKKGRGRRSRYPYATCAIGESFEIDAGSPAITLNHSLIGNRAFQVEIKNGRFLITRTK